MGNIRQDWRLEPAPRPGGESTESSPSLAKAAWQRFTFAWARGPAGFNKLLVLKVIKPDPRPPTRISSPCSSTRRGSPRV